MAKSWPKKSINVVLPRGAQQDKYSYSVQDELIQDTVQFSDNYSLWPKTRVISKSIGKYRIASYPSH